MSIRVLIFLEVFWLLFWGFWTFLGIGFSGEQATAVFLQDSFMFFLIFLFVGVGPLLLTISRVRKSFSGKN
jgi:hypothetical protein